MVKVSYRARKASVLTPSSLACLAHVPTVNLTAGCAHGCLYCYTRGYSCYPGPGRLVIYGNTLEKLQHELDRRRSKPRAVYFSSASDLFQPVPEVLDLTYDVLACLLGRGIGVAFLTKGSIPGRHLRLLQSHAGLVRAQIGLITLDANIAATFEPNAPPPSVRLAQIGALIAGNIRPQVRLDPILPGLTDGAGSLAGLLSQLAEAGVTTIAASTLFLRPAVASSLKRSLPADTCRGLLRSFRPGGRLAIHAENSSVTALPAQVRDAIYQRVTEIAGRYGIQTRACACKNPDIASQSCSITGDWAPDLPGASQPPLFAGTERTQHDTENRRG